MALIAPFRGLRFNPEKINDLEDVVTPPYDIIDEKTQAAFEARNQYNMIKLDIRKTPGPVNDSDERYKKASDYFDLWQKEQILVRDRDPAIYLYHIDYKLPRGKRFTRKGLVALVRLSEFSEGIVKPHEETFKTVTSDRLLLMDACQAQFSQIFSLYSDKEGEVIDILEQARGQEPICQVRDGEGARHTIWPVTDTTALTGVRELFKDRFIYIADGHHRYTTALKFRELMRERKGHLEPDSPYNYVMMYLCAMEDPGLSVLPTHRLVYLPSGRAVENEQGTLDRVIARLAEGFYIEEMRGGAREVLLYEVLARMDENRKQVTMFGCYHPGEDRCVLLTLKDGVMEKLSAVDRPQALRELDVVVLSDLVLHRFLGLDHEICEKENLVHYYSDPDEALDVAVKASLSNRDKTPLLFLMNNPPVEQVRKVADERLIMPHKSTYFYPKILTGLLINKLASHEA